PKTTYLYYTDEGYAAEYTHNGNHPNSEASITPTLSQLYLFAPQGLWSTEPIAIKQSGEQGGWRYPETDHLGTPHGLISKDGTETTDLRANAFGQTEVNGESLPLRFAGQTEDDETGGYYNFHRDYEPGLGRYRESDPIGLEGGLQNHGYVRQSPLTSMDPGGLARVPVYQIDQYWIIDHRPRIKSPIDGSLWYGRCFFDREDSTCEMFKKTHMVWTAEASDGCVLQDVNTTSEERYLPSNYFNSYVLTQETTWDYGQDDNCSNCILSDLRVEGYAEPDYPFPKSSNEPEENEYTN
ncbi:MAG: RHS repeat-associated core domain-containing protein, partial [Xanthomonadales bacterium]|nr:RHS repeat-associated core domain-containing protein [Xanthomonadales bacterium]